MTKEITLIQPDDMHLHVRDGAALENVIAHTAERFGRAIIMPNLKPPITSVAMAGNYRDRILSALPNGSEFEPLMTLYLTDVTSKDDIKKVYESSFVYALKLYPAGATTNSDAGVTSIENTYDSLEAMSELGVPLLVHGEALKHNDDEVVDVFDREKVFIEQTLHPLTERFPDLKIVFEHITTDDAVRFVKNASDNVAATITPQHLMYERNEIFKGGIRPHFYCLPILKRKRHQLSLIEAATSGNPFFFLGTDSAPHTKSAKENACGCAGIYSAHAGIELYAEVFEKANALDKLEGFASKFGADFYDLPYNKKTITLKKEDWTVPSSYPFNNEVVIPLLAEETLSWKLV